MNRSYSGKRAESNRWVKHALDIHYEKLKNMRPTLEIAKPQEFPHLNSRAKKEKQREDRFTEIERANKILLDRMSGILNTKSSISVPFKKKSLNTEIRKKFQEKIADDNKSFLKRLQCRTPVYSIQRWEKEWKQTEKRLKNISEYSNKSVPRLRTKAETSRNILLKKTLELNSRSFLVEISRKKDEIKVVLYDPDISESYSLQIPYSEALELMGGVEDFDALTNLLKVENDEIIITAGKQSN